MKKILNIIYLIVFLIIMSGCAATGYTSYLDQYIPPNDNHTFKIKFTEKNDYLNKPAQKLYPTLFSIDETALSLELIKYNLDIKKSWSKYWSFIIYVGSICTLPHWQEIKSSYTFQYNLKNKFNEIIHSDTEDYYTERIELFSFYTPSAIWLAPDSKQIPKFRGHGSKRVENEQFIHAIAKSVYQADQNKLEKAYLETDNIGQRYDLPPEELYSPPEAYVPPTKEHDSVSEEYTPPPIQY